MQTGRSFFGKTFDEVRRIAESFHSVVISFGKADGFAADYDGVYFVREVVGLSKM